MTVEEVGKEWDRLATPLHRQRWLGVSANQFPDSLQRAMQLLTFYTWSELSNEDRQDITEWLEAKKAAEDLTNG